MLEVEQLHMTLEGMDIGQSLLVQFRKKGAYPTVTSALRQFSGNPLQSVYFSATLPHFYASRFILRL